MPAALSNLTGYTVHSRQIQAGVCVGEGEKAQSLNPHVSETRLTSLISLNKPMKWELFPFFK